MKSEERAILEADIRWLSCQKDKAKEDLDTAVRLAWEAGVPFTKIAQWLDQSEAAVRMKFKRRGWSNAQTETHQDSGQAFS